MMASFYLLLCIVLIGVCCFVYWWLTMNYGYLESQSVQVIKKPLPFIGTNEFLWTKPIHLKDLDAYRKYGKVFGLYEGRKATLVIADPDLMKRIFVENFHTCPYKEYLAFNNTHPTINQCITNLRSDPWRRMHRVTAKMFAFEKIKELLPLIGESAESLIDNIKESSLNSDVIDINKLSFLYSTSVIAKAVFAIDDDIFKQERYHPFLMNVKKINNPNTLEAWTFNNLPILNNLFSDKKRTVKYFVDLAERTLLQRKQNYDESMRVDFLQLLLDAQEDEEILMKNPLAKILHQFPKAFTDEFIVAHLVIFVFVAVTPIASAITFTAYALAKNTEVQEAVANEISRFVHENDDVVDSTVLAKLRYTDSVIAESLRMYPPLVRNERICVRPYRLRTCVIKPGMSVVIPIYSIHNDPEYYPNPEIFDPNRFRDRPARHQLTYLPFGLGPRKCVGKDLAMLEIKMAIIYLMQNYHLELTKESQHMKYRVGSTYLKPAKGVKLRLIERKKTPPKPAVLLYEKYLMSRKQRRKSSADGSPSGSHADVPIPETSKTVDKKAEDLLKKKKMSDREKLVPTPPRTPVIEKEEELLLDLQMSQTLRDYIEDLQDSDEDEESKVETDEQSTSGSTDQEKT